MVLPLFSSYIFVRIGRDGRVPVLEVPGVISIVGSVREPLPVPDSYIHFLREGLKQGKVEPHPYLATGTKVRIRSGVMAGMEGFLVYKKNRSRVVLTLEMIMKSVTVEVAIDDIEPSVCLTNKGGYAERISFVLSRASTVWHSSFSAK